MKNHEGDDSRKVIEDDANLTRRKALAKLGLLAVATYAAPLFLKISDAHAGGGSGGGSGGDSGGSGSSGGSGGGSHGGSGGSSHGGSGGPTPWWSGKVKGRGKGVSK